MAFRHFHPILARVAERFRRYRVPSAFHRIRHEVFTLREEEGNAELESMHDTLRLRRITALGKP